MFYVAPGCAIENKDLMMEGATNLFLDPTPITFTELALLDEIPVQLLKNNFHRLSPELLDSIGSSKGLKITDIVGEFSLQHKEEIFSVGLWTGLGLILLVALISGCICYCCPCLCCRCPPPGHRDCCKRRRHAHEDDSEDEAESFPLQPLPTQPQVAISYQPQPSQPQPTNYPVQQPSAPSTMNAPYPTYQLRQHKLQQLND